MEDNRMIGENVRRYRLLKGLKQEELCDGLCSVSQLSKIENGKAQVKMPQLQVMADRLGVTLSALQSADVVMDELTDMLRLAKQTALSGLPQKALELAQSVMEQAKSHGYPALYVEGLEMECRQLNRLRRYPQVIEKIEAAFAEELPISCKLRVELLIDLGRAYAAAGDMMKGYVCFMRADEEFARVEGLDEVYMRLLYELGDCHFQMHNNREGYQYAQRAEQAAQELSKDLWRVRAVCMQANFLGRRGQIDVVEPMFLACLQEAEDHSFLQIVGVVNNNLGYLAFLRNDLQQAKVYLQRSVQVFEILNDKGLLCEPLVNLALVAQAAGEAKECREHAAQVLEIAEQIGGLGYLYVARANRILGRLAAQLGDRATYLERLQQVLTIYEQHRVMIDAYEVAVELAHALDEQQDPAALELYRRAVEYSNQVQTIGIKQPEE